MKNYFVMMVAASALLGGCAIMPDTIVQAPLTARPQAASAIAPPTNGAIFQNAAYRPM